MENQSLEVIVKESGLEPSKAKYILEKFTDYFNIADEWSKRAKTIVVTRADQKTDMQMARVGRLFLKEKRIAVETARKELKEQCLREGKAIDGISNVLKALIVPIEEYLETQERFVEIQEEKKTEAHRLEIEARMAEEERIAAEKAAAEQERLRVENENLKKEAAEREAKITEERRQQEAILAKERAKADAERKERDQALAKEREKVEADRKAQEKKLAAERAKVQAEKDKAEAEAAYAAKVAEEKARKEKEKAAAKLAAEREEKERLEALLKAQITCPACGKKFTPNQKK